MPKLNEQSATAKANRRSRVRVQRSVSPRPARTAIEVAEDAWYYEYRGRIEIIHRDISGPVPTFRHIDIPWKILMASARRCRPEETTRANAELSDRRD